MGFTISAEYSRELTEIPNWFIRTYMPSSNGNFVKIYLTLAMSCQHAAGGDTLSVAALADSLECTENDVLRALRYWQKEGILSFEEEKGELHSIVLLDHPRKQPDSLMTTVPAPTPDFAAPETVLVRPPQTVYKLPVRQEYTPLQAEALVKDVEIDQTVNGVEKLLGSTISVTHLQLILYFMCDVGFTQELILAMYRTALDRGNNSPKYIEAIGINWAKKGIRSLEDAETEASNFGGLYHLVAKALGIRRSLAPAEREIIDNWRSYGFTDEIIQEACRRTVLQTGGTNLNYTSSILKDWNRLQITTLSDIEKCDESFHNRRQSTPQKTAPATKNQFQNFPQRTYSKEEYSTLEKQLLRGIQA